MSITGKIKTLFTNKEKTEALFPRTKVNAITDDNGIGLNILLENIETSLVKKATTTSYTGTFSSSGWSSTAPYTQSITVDGILVTDNPFVDIDLSNVSDGSAVTEAWNCVSRVTASANDTITVYCYEEKPTVDIPIILKVVR